MMIHFWVAIGLLTALFIYLMRRPTTTAAPPPDNDRPRMKVTVVKKDDSVLNKLSVLSDSGSKGVHVSESQVEEWFKRNPSLKEANKSKEV